MASGQPRLVKLNDTNWFTWMPGVKGYLVRENLWDNIVTGPPDMSEAQ